MKVPVYAVFVFVLKILSINSRKLSGRVINGKLATLGQFPWFVSVKMDDDCCCGGTLISSKWVLTAAHCFNETIKAYCYFGSLEEGRGFEVVSKNIVIHPKYRKRSFRNDVTLIELSFRIYFNDTITLIRLAKDWMTYKYLLYRTTTLAGTGVSNIDENPLRLRYTRMKVMPPRVCEMNSMDPPEMRICTKPKDRYLGKNPCFGDSGGGLLYRYKKKYYIVGTVSYGIHDCKTDIKAKEVFNSVQMHLDWIESTLGVFQYPSLD